ncbi:hypothetical protein A5819_002383 [Enterococcus sp. 7E2_DIV0204]|uniref:protein kinase family protein n=1 Tax=unclassified Enterococcus TaxID=2608891 RepID=UPI000A34E4DD|nr:MULTISPECIES: protein kinase family protein [unclassified Enterococcus]OTN89885.1 hypothetical protein A5819_002383 [Enterococcus sp. 7E2_DIV0204]OTP52341.1 hypothetical protein A5884_001542 [Enterococcus sp. 7D2_DIV0200]
MEIIQTDFSNMTQLDEKLKEIVPTYLLESKDDYREYKSYKHFAPESLGMLLADLHHRFNNYFNNLNQKVSPSKKKNPGTILIKKKVVQKILTLSNDLNMLERILKKYGISIQVDSGYLSRLQIIIKGFKNPQTNNMMSKDYTKMDIRFDCIFNLYKNKTQMEIEIKGNRRKIEKPKVIGRGSYATILKYKDIDYQHFFVIKQANKNLTDSEMERFKKEYECMKSLNSPHIGEVYDFDNEKNQYVMEYIDKTLYDYIIKNNDSMKKEERYELVRQLFCAFEYIHSKALFHRDISYSNIMVKLFDDKSVLLKVTDFGYVKEKNSNLTRRSTNFIGSLNDSDLLVYGYDNYNVQHEIFALTRVIHFIMTGKQNTTYRKSDEIQKFISLGMDSDKKNIRAKSLEELKESFYEMEWF